MKTHILNSWPVYFNEIWLGKKTFEIRENDCGFQVGDRVVLKEFLCVHEVCTGREIVAEITYLTHFLQNKGFVVFSMKNISCRTVPKNQSSIHIYHSEKAGNRGKVH